MVNEITYFAYFFRYLELLHPIWHKVHFKIKYLYVALIGCWIFGIGLNAAYVIPTSKVFQFKQFGEELQDLSEIDNIVVKIQTERQFGEIHLA